MSSRIHSWLRRAALLVLAVPLGSAWAATATFDGARCVLTLPDVKVGNSTYVNVLLDVVNPVTLTFRLREATLAQTPVATNTSFDGASWVETPTAPRSRSPTRPPTPSC